MKKTNLKENSLENITWPENGKTNCTSLRGQNIYKMPEKNPGLSAFTYKISILFFNFIADSF